MNWNTLAQTAEAVWDRLPIFLRRAILFPWCRRIDSIKRSSTKPSILFLPLLSWYYAGFQRPQQMARALAELGCPVFYCEPITPASPDIRPANDRRRGIGLKKISDCLWLIRGPKILAKDILRFCGLDGVVMSWPWQAKWFASDSRAFLLYETVDHYSLESGTQHVLHERLLKEADLVMATADDLLAELKPIRPDALLIPNAVRPEDWFAPEAPEVPSDMIEARRAEVVIGYMGAIASWFDWPLWEELARARPNWAFVLIGYAADSSGREAIEKGNRLPNIYYLGPKSPDELKNYLGHFDVATIPFVLNQVTHACSPLKLFEYMARGKPVVATPMREILKYQTVRFARDVESFLKEIESALVAADTPAFQKAAQDEARNNSWRKRAGYLLEALKEAKKQQRDIPRRHLVESGSKVVLHPNV